MVFVNKILFSSVNNQFDCLSAANSFSSSSTRRFCSWTRLSAACLAPKINPFITLSTRHKRKSVSKPKYWTLGGAVCRYNLPTRPPTASSFKNTRSRIKEMKTMIASAISILCLIKWSHVKYILKQTFTRDAWFDLDCRFLENYGVGSLTSTMKMDKTIILHMWIACATCSQWWASCSPCWHPDDWLPWQ